MKMPKMCNNKKINFFHIPPLSFFSPSVIKFWRNIMPENKPLCMRGIINNTVCPRSLDPLYIVKLKTSLTYSSKE